VQLREKEAEFK